MTSQAIPEECTRTEQEIEARKYRAELYRTLRAANDKSKQDSELDDILDDFGGSSSSKKSSGNSGNFRAMVKKVQNVYSSLSTLCAANADSIVESLQDCNLFNFLQETIDHLMKAKIKMEDVPSFVRVASILAEKYGDKFVEPFKQQLFDVIKSEETTHPRRRTILCVLADLIIIHVFNSSKPLFSIISKLIDDDIDSLTFENDSYIWRIFVHCGGDLVGVNCGPNTIMDPIFPVKECICPDLRKYVGKYYNTMVKKMSEIAQEGMEAREESYQLFLKMGKFNTRPTEKAQNCKEEYSKLLAMARKYGFMMKKVPEEFWTEETDMVEITTPGGAVLIPKRIAEQIRPNDPITSMTNKSETEPLVDINATLATPMKFDIDGIRKELEHAQDIKRVDDLSLYYLSIHSPENQIKLIEDFSHISRANINIAHFYARFIANISQKYPEIGEEISHNLESSFINFVNAQNKSGRDAYNPKLHIARYLAELTLLNVGIESYFTCLQFSLRNFVGRTIDMACTLILTSGQFLDKFCDSTHIRIRNAIDTLKRFSRKEAINNQHSQVIINQVIGLFEKTEETVEHRQAPATNKYQAYTRYIIFTTDRANYANNSKSIIEKMWAYSDTTEVDMYFVISVILDLTNFGVSQLKGLASLCAEISITNPDFGITLVDILLERIRRGLERDNYLYRQKQLLEVRFLSELINERLVSYEVGINTATQILSLNMPNPKMHLISIQGKKTRSILKRSDFFKVKMVCELLDALFPTLQKLCVDKMNKSVYRPNDDHNFKNSKNVMLYFHLIIHLQLFVLIREPIPTSTSFDLSDLLDKFESAHIERTVKYESIQNEELREIANGMDFSTFSIYSISKPLQIVKMPKINKGSSGSASASDDGEEEYDADEDDASFRKALNELKEEFRLEDQHPGVKRQINIPVSLLAAPAKELTPEEKMTMNGPPADFTIAISDGAKPLVLSFAPPPKETPDPK